MTSTFKRIFESTRGQSIIELTFITPLLLLLVFGTVEVSLMISSFLDLTHLSREGANLTSRGTDPNLALDGITTIAYPTVRQDNIGEWKIIYSKITQDLDIPCPPVPCTYKVESQITRGNLSELSKIGATGQKVQTDGIDNVGPFQIFHVIEVFYAYQPKFMDLVDKVFYDRTIFTNVSSVT